MYKDSSKTRSGEDAQTITFSGSYLIHDPYEVSEEDLTTTFAEYGAVRKVQLPTDRETGRKRGFGFVEMENDADEEKAIAELDGAEWMGRSLKVNKARPRENRGSGGGRRY